MKSRTSKFLSLTLLLLKNITKLCICKRKYTPIKGTLTCSLIGINRLIKTPWRTNSVKFNFYEY